jgi:hypothetical protein
MANPKTSKINTLAAKVSITNGPEFGRFGAASGAKKYFLTSGMEGLP